MRHVATLALILGSTSMAFADDGEDYGGPSSVEPVAPPAPYAAPIVDAAPMAHPVMATRWSVGLGVGSFTVAPEQSPDATTDFDITELSLRFRATYHLELELNLMGGRQVLGDGTQGSQALGGGTLGLRYRFAAAQPWNWWVMAGVGETTIADHAASRQELDAAAQPHGQLGFGVERRFRRFAVQAELRLTSIGDAQTHQAMMPPPNVRPPIATDPGMPTPTPEPLPPVDVAPVPQRQQAGQVTIGLSYYF